MVKDIFIFKHFKEFASFCLEQKFEDLCSDYVRKLEELNGSSLEVLAHLSEEEINCYFKEKLKIFLQSAINDSAFVETEKVIKNWKLGKLPAGIDKYAVQPSDILLGFAARKHALLQHLPSFTQDLTYGLHITRELNIFNLLIEERIFKAYIDIQQEIISEKNEELKKANLDLQSLITERMRVEESLRREKEFSDAVINNSKDGIFAFDKNLRITAWNHTLEKLNGISRHQVIGKNIFDLFPAYKNQEEGEALLKVLNGEAVDLGSKLYSGQKGFYEANMIPLRNDRQEITGGITIIQDITNRKITEEKLRQREIALNEAQSIAHLGNWEWITRNNKFIWSDEVFRIFGYKPYEVPVTMDLFFQHLFEEDVELIKSIIIHTYNNLGSFSFDVKIKRKDGELRYLLVKGKVFAYHNNIPFKMMGIVWDITDRKLYEEALRKKNFELEDKNEELKLIQDELTATNNELEERVIERTKQLSHINNELNNEIAEKRKIEIALKQRNEELIKINDDLDNFVYTASHDLKAPISNIEGLVNSLIFELKEIDGEAKTIIDLINQSIIKFKETINDLTEITKAQKNLEEDIALIDLNILLEEIKLSIKDLIKNSQAEIIYNGCSFPLVRFSKANLKSILYNLLSNAIKYCHPDRSPVITIGCEKAEGYVILSVKDNGLGINPEQKAKVFTMFKRLHDHVEGSGIGLYLVKRIVDNNGGKIDLESEEGKGSEFKIFLKA